MPAPARPRRRGDDKGEDEAEVSDERHQVGHFEEVPRGAALHFVLLQSCLEVCDRLSRLPVRLVPPQPPRVGDEDPLQGEEGLVAHIK